MLRLLGGCRQLLPYIPLYETAATLSFSSALRWKGAAPDRFENLACVDQHDHPFLCRR